MKQADMFKKLGAVLTNSRWSWGAARSDGAVFLRVWHDRVKEEGAKRYAQVTHINAYVNKPNHPGHRERLRHVERIRQGNRCYLVMCEAKDPTSRPRKIKKFNDQAVFTGGELIERDGDSWIELGELIPIEDVAEAVLAKTAEQEFLEGRERIRLHLHKERNRKAVRRKKEETLDKRGKLLCEACDFDFEAVYGELGAGFVECHHRTPIATLTKETRIRLSELAIVCANCHRMLHRRPFHSVEALRKLVIDQKLFG